MLIRGAADVFAVLQGERGKTHPLVGVGSEVRGRGENERAASRRCGCLHPTSHFSGAFDAEQGARTAFQSWKRRYKYTIHDAGCRMTDEAVETCNQ
jgi:hypothetical protein